MLQHEFTQKATGFRQDNNKYTEYKILAEPIDDPQGIVGIQEWF